jgi:hypothetical protein
MIASSPPRPWTLPAQISSSLDMKEAIKPNYRQPKIRKNVSISDRPAIVHEIKSLDTYNEEERKGTWFTRKEFSDIKMSYKDIIRRMRNREYLQDTEELSTRGLEGRSSAGARSRQLVVSAGILAVLNEQQLQKKEGRNDPEILAIIYRQHSYHSLQAAALMGRRDEAVISDYTGRSSLPSQRWVHTPVSSSAPHPSQRSLSIRNINTGFQPDGKSDEVSLKKTSNQSVWADPALRGRAAAA